MPPVQSPITIAYAEGHLLVSSMTIVCQWNSVSQAFIHDLQNPSLLELLALECTVPRAEMAGTGLGRKIRSARMKLERRLKNAASQLEEFEVTEAELGILSRQGSGLAWERPVNSRYPNHQNCFDVWGRESHRHAHDTTQQKTDGRRFTSPVLLPI